MTTLTEEELNALDGGLQDASFDKVTANNFVGHLTGVADKAKELYESQALVLQGDASGKTYIGKGNASITVTVHESEHAKVADYCGNATDSLNASKADLANIATYAYKSGKAEHAIESDHAAESDHATESDHALNADNAKVADVALKDNAGHKIDDTLTTLIDNDASVFSHLGYVDGDIATLKNDVKTNASGIESNRTDIDANAANIDTLQSITSSHTQSISDHEERLSNIEGTSEIGKFAVRMKAVETKNTEQDSRLDAIEALNLELVNTEQNSRLDAIESVNSEQDERINKVELINETQTTNLNNHLSDTSAHSEIFAKYAQTVNGIGADSSGNITLPLNYLPLSGGQLSGNIYRNSDEGRLFLGGGTNWNCGAHLVLNGKDNNSGVFALVAHDGTDTSVLHGYANGTLTWRNREINPIGEVVFFARSSAPKGYLVCNGAEV
ncbi:MAG: hypothetical protein ACI4M9_07220, partial [Succinivibrio sp.]